MGRTAIRASVVISPGGDFNTTFLLADKKGGSSGIDSSMEEFADFIQMASLLLWEDMTLLGPTR